MIYSLENQLFNTKEMKKTKVRPFAAVQPLYKYTPEENTNEFVGSCFRLWANNHFFTAAHCIHGLAPGNINVLDLPQGKFLPCVRIHRHPNADVAIIEVEGTVSPILEKFTLAQYQFSMRPLLLNFHLLYHKG